MPRNLVLRWLMFTAIIVFGGLLIALLTSLMTGIDLRSLPTSRFIGSAISAPLVALACTFGSTRQQTRPDGEPAQRPR